MTDTDRPDDFIGTFDDQHTVRFELFYPHPIEAVWRAITDAEQLAEWFLFIVVEPRVGGSVFRRRSGELDQRTHGTVTAFEPPRLLEYEFNNAAGWPDSVLRFELVAVADGCRMSFTQRLAPDILWTPEPDDTDHMPPGAAAGWQYFFVESLVAILDGRRPPAVGEIEALDRARTEQCRAMLAARFS